MNLKQASEAGIRRLRLFEWSDRTYIELPLLPDGMHGPWILLFDPYAQKAGIPLFWGSLTYENQFEEYTGPAWDAPDQRTGEPFVYPEHLEPIDED
jgi:hypothetical protein